MGKNPNWRFYNGENKPEKSTRQSMKFKNSSLLATTFTKCVLCTFALSLTAIPDTANAKPAQQVAQANQQPSVAPPPQITLTAQQQEQVKKINLKVRNDINKVLDTNQRKQLEISLKARRTPQQITTDLKLSQQQGQKLRQIVVASQQQIFNNVLTEQQRQQIKQYQQSRQNQR
jgi:periplasmic protein CpxP/Spy